MIVSLKTNRILNLGNLIHIIPKKFLLISNHTIAFHLLLAHAAIKTFKIRTFLVAMHLVVVLSYKNLLAINQKSVLKEC